MRVDLSALGAKAFERLAAAIEGGGGEPRIDHITPELMVRQSCGQVWERESAVQNTNGPGRYPE
jgi:DNA-binding LacI/PurR family transcriptional regulator